MTTRTTGYERDEIARYMELEAPDETVSHLEKIATRSLAGSRYQIWDVWTDQGRWWVISPLTNLYSQEDFQSMEMALTYHLGLMQAMSVRDRRPLSNHDHGLLAAFRKMDRATTALDEAEEAEDFQAVGNRFREALLALIQAFAEPRLVPHGESVKRSDFLRWSELITDAYAPGESLERMRTHLKSHARDTWQIVSWLIHYAHATRDDAKIAESACNHLVDMLLTVRDRLTKTKSTCPACMSNRVREFFRHEEWVYVTVCEACGWESDKRRAEP